MLFYVLLLCSRHAQDSPKYGSKNHAATEWCNNKISHFQATGGKEWRGQSPTVKKTERLLGITCDSKEEGRKQITIRVICCCCCLWWTVLEDMWFFISVKIVDSLFKRHIFRLWGGWRKWLTWSDCELLKHQRNNEERKSFIMTSSVKCVLITINLRSPQAKYSKAPNKMWQKQGLRCIRLQKWT